MASVAADPRTHDTGSSMADAADEDFTALSREELVERARALQARR